MIANKGLDCSATYRLRAGAEGYARHHRFSLSAWAVAERLSACCRTHLNITDMPVDLSPGEAAYLEANAFIHSLIDEEAQDAKFAKKYLVKNKAEVPATWTDREIIRRAIAFRNEVNAGANGATQAVATHLSLCFSAPQFCYVFQELLHHLCKR